MFITKCKCGGDLLVIEARVFFRVRLSPDGYDISETRHMETLEELVECEKCEARSPLQWVDD